MYVLNTYSDFYIPFSGTEILFALLLIFYRIIFFFQKNVLFHIYDEKCSLKYILKLRRNLKKSIFYLKEKYFYAVYSVSKFS